MPKAVHVTKSALYVPEYDETRVSLINRADRGRTRHLHVERLKAMKPTIDTRRTTRRPETTAPNVNRRRGKTRELLKERDEEIRRDNVTLLQNLGSINHRPSPFRPDDAKRRAAAGRGAAARRREARRIRDENMALIRRMVRGSERSNASFFSRCRPFRAARERQSFEFGSSLNAGRRQAVLRPQYDDARAELPPERHSLVSDRVASVRRAQTSDAARRPPEAVQVAARGVRAAAPHAVAATPRGDVRERIRRGEERRLVTSSGREARRRVLYPRGVRSLSFPPPVLLDRGRRPQCVPGAGDARRRARDLKRPRRYVLATIARPANTASLRIQFYFPDRVRTYATQLPLEKVAAWLRLDGRVLDAIASAAGAEAAARDPDRVRGPRRRHTTAP